MPATGRPVEPRRRQACRRNEIAPARRQTPGAGNPLAGARLVSDSTAPAARVKCVDCGLLGARNYNARQLDEIPGKVRRGWGAKTNLRVRHTRPTRFFARPPPTPPPLLHTPA